MNHHRGGAVSRVLMLLLVNAVSLLNPPAALAEAGWFESGDVVLRNDLLLLNDAGIIRLPVTEWPLPRAAVRYALENSKELRPFNSAASAALARVRARTDGTRFRGDRAWSVDTGISGGDAALLRNFATPAREDGEVGARVAYETDRTAVALNVAGVTSPDDGQELRVDGSHATLQFGNWLLSANTLDRFWGPSHESSLIMSNNARPMTTIMVERAAAMPFDSKWLSWLGPWRFSLGFSRMEGERQDIDRPLFMAWRVVVMPFKDIEIGFSRTAQFCGEQQNCELSTFGDLLVGNDNVGIDTTAENEPGNQMAGFDIRWASPLGGWPYAIYSQMIGEDESSYTPAKYIAQFGAEAWIARPDGGVFQIFTEYSTTTCSASTDRGPYYNCAYNQGQFNIEGYRYRGRVIGYTADRDAENYALGGTFTTSDGTLWSATARTARLNRDNFGDWRNTVATVPTDYEALEFGWQGRLFGDQITVNLGVESIEPARAEREVSPFGFVTWTHEFGQ